MPGSGEMISIGDSIIDDSEQSIPSTSTWVAGSGSGANLQVTGAGTVTLSGTNTYIGSTTVSSGTLIVNGTLYAGGTGPDSQVIVSQGATLRGIGTILGAVNISSGGILSPGNSIGTITMSSLTLNSGSTTQIEIDPSSSSEIIVTGTATLGGIIQLTQDPGTYPTSGSYTILTATAITIGSSFEPAVQGGLPGYVFTLEQNSDSVLLNYMLAPPSPPSPPAPVAISTEGLTGNNLKLANYLNSFGFASAELQSLLTLSGNTLNKALSSVSPARNSFGTFVSQNTTFSLSEVVSSHLNDERLFQFGRKQQEQKNTKEKTAFLAAAGDLPRMYHEANDDYAIWMGAFGDIAHEKAEHQAPAFDFNTEGVVVAFDVFGKNESVVGIGIGYAHSHIHEQQDAGKANINYYIATAYGTKYFSKFYLEGVFWGVFNQIHNERHIFYPGVDVTAKSKIYGWQFTPHLGLGYDAEMSWGGIEPFAAVDWAINWERKFQEHGAGSLNMREKSHTSSMLRSEGGLRFFETWEWDWGYILLKEKLSYVNMTPFGSGKVTAAIVGDPSFFTVEILNSTINLGAAGLDFCFQPGKKSPLITLSYNGEFGMKYRSSEVLLKIAKNF